MAERIDQRIHAVFKDLDKELAGDYVMTPEVRHALYNVENTRERYGPKSEQYIHAASAFCKLLESTQERKKRAKTCPTALSK